MNFDVLNHSLLSFEGVVLFNDQYFCSIPRAVLWRGFLEGKRGVSRWLGKSEILLRVRQEVEVYVDFLTPMNELIQGWVQ